MKLKRIPSELFLKDLEEIRNDLCMGKREFSKLVSPNGNAKTYEKIIYRIRSGDSKHTNAKTYISYMSRAIVEKHKRNKG